MNYVTRCKHEAMWKMHELLGGLDADDVAMFDSATDDQLADWIDDLEARVGLDVGDARSAMLDYRFAKFPPDGECIVFRDLAANVMWCSRYSFQVADYDPAQCRDFVIDVPPAREPPPVKPEPAPTHPAMAYHAWLTSKAISERDPRRLQWLQRQLGNALRAANDFDP